MDLGRRTALSLFFKTKNKQKEYYCDSVKKTKTPNYMYPTSFKYLDNSDSGPDTLDISFHDSSGKWINSWLPKEGNEIGAKIHVKNWKKKGDNRLMDCGTFEVEECSADGPPQIFNISAVACPLSNGFSATKKYKTWKDVTLKQIVAEIAKNAGCAYLFNAENFKVENMQQSNISDMQFLYNICSEYSMTFRIFKKKIVVFDVLKLEKQEASGTIKRKMCSSWNLKNTLCGIYGGVQIKYSKKDSDQTLVYKYDLKSENKKILKIHEKADSLKEAEKKAKAALWKENREAWRVSLDMPGDVKYYASKCYNLEGFGKFDGKYYVDSIEHSLVGKYMIHLEMHKTVEF